MDDLVSALSLFRNKRVLVTGDTGFKGSWLCLWLVEAGAQVYGYALPPERSNDHFNLLRLPQRITHQDGDIRNLAETEAFFAKAQPEFVFHLAAQALVRRSYREPKETFDTNVSGSVNVLECVRHTASVRSLIFVTSDKCYKNKEWVWGYRENDELGGHDPYSASKAAAELVFSSYGDSFLQARESLGYASVRAGNVIGGGDWSEDRIVPDCIRALSENRPIILRKPLATRPWQHVLEPLAGYLRLAAALYSAPREFSGAWNFGPSHEATRTVQELAQAIVKVWGSGEVEAQISNADPHEAGQLRLNCDKAIRQLGWYPRWHFTRTMQETVSWYRQAVSSQDVYAISAAQVRAYRESEA